MEITEAELEQAARTLAGSDRGRKAMASLHALLYDEGGISLDDDNQRSFLILLQGAFGSWSGTAREIMDAFLEDQSPEPDSAPIFP